MVKWPTVRLATICHKITDGSHNPPKGIENSEYLMLSSKNVFDDEITFDKPRFLSEQNFNSENKRTDVMPGDVLLTIVGTVGRAAVVPTDSPKFTLQRSVAVLKPDNNQIDSRFLMFSLQSILEVLNDGARGVAQKGIYLKALRELQIPLPPLPEQKRIVAILDEAFAGIDAAVANTEKNLANARELFESYLNGVFTRKGDGWVEKTLGECFRLKSGDALTSKAMIAGDYPVYGGNGVAGTHNQYNITDENVIIGRVGALCGNARHIKEKIWLTDNAFKVVDQKYRLDNAFLAYLLNFKNLRSFARQAAQPVISNSSLKDIKLSFPVSEVEQRLIVEWLDALKCEKNNLVAIYQQKLDALAELKQSILQKAFAGKLTTLPEKILKEAVA